MTRLELVLAMSMAIAGCQGDPGIVPDGQMELHLNNGTPLGLVLVVNGHPMPVAAKTQVDFSAPNLPALPWVAEVRTATGRTLLALTVRSGDIIERSNGSMGDLARVDLSCGRIDLWSGPPAVGPVPGPGAPGDCLP